jgi:nitrate/TMAO reductase-like tetraheme cytochrome c subunit
MIWSVTIKRMVLVALLVAVLMPVAAIAEETVCIQCHAGQPGRLGEPVGEWRGSVHDKNGISCHDCHGGDPTDFANAKSAEAGFIGAPDYVAVPEFCGRCHIGVKEDYLSSVHGQALEAGGPNCVMCHGNHAVKLATIDLINEQSCSRCHDYERAKNVKQVISSTEATLVELEASVAALHRVGFDMERLKDALFAQRNGFRRLFHTVNPEKIQRQKAEFDEGLAGIQEEVTAYEEEIGQRKIIGGAVVLLLLLGGCVALLIRRSYHSQE